jgi:cytochrome c peroxidase
MTNYSIKYNATRAALPLAICLCVLACTKDGSISNSTRLNILIPKQSIPPTIPEPPDNLTTKEGVALGRFLFYDSILSTDYTLSCASCHQQANAFSDPVKYSKGVGGAVGVRHAMALFNLAWDPSYFWDGRVRTLEEQALKPIVDELEMQSNLDSVINRLNRSAFYRQLFFEAFGVTKVTSVELAKAIAQFERSIISGNSKYDLWARGEASLDNTELLGKSLFTDEQKGDCTHCHSLGSLFSDFGFKNNGLDAIPTDSGRYRVTGFAGDIGKFKSPTLRNIALTAPYMHDGRFATLDQVLAHYNIGFKASSTLDGNIAKHVKARMTIPETKAIIAFLQTLTDSSLINNPNYSNPFR